jgi:Xaa-Pro aminopeptidase
VQRFGEPQAIEPEHLSYKTYTVLKQCWPEAEFTSTTADVLELRRTKNPDEIARIRGVVKLLEAGYAAEGPLKLTHKNLTSGGTLI